jgi:outer membrane protein assembly factor BamE
VRANLRFILPAIAASLIAACSWVNPLSVYLVEIQQGNYITQEMVSQLKRGMTKDQVRFVLGTPLVTDIFHDNRWDYVYWRQLAHKDPTEERRLTVLFEDGKLTQLTGDVTTGLPESPQASATEGAR